MKTQSSSRDHEPSIGSALDWERAPEGWRPLSEPAEEWVPVEGLLSNGRTTEAEWWGPVPEELWDSTGDGSGWAWSDAGICLDGSTMIAWRPYSSAKPAERDSSRDAT